MKNKRFHTQRQALAIFRKNLAAAANILAIDPSIMFQAIKSLPSSGRLSLPLSKRNKLLIDEPWYKAPTVATVSRFAQMSIGLLLTTRTELVKGDKGAFFKSCIWIDSSGPLSAVAYFPRSIVKQCAQSV